jgi:alpha-glucosidase (family GH31 glycosyl hydrolase)
MMAVYYQTHLFISANIGYPLIKPLFYEWPEDQNTYNEIDKQFMLGPSFKIHIVNLITDKNDAYFPQGVFCEISYDRSPVECRYQEKGGLE